MFAVLDHPKLSTDWFTTVLLRWHSDGLVIYDRWVLNGSGLNLWTHSSGGDVLLDFYYFTYFFAFCVLLFFLTKYRREGWLRVKPHVPYDVVLIGLAGVLIGAKVTYIFVYYPEFYFGDPPVGPPNTSEMLSRIFLNWSGMASHGAITGCVLGAFFYWLFKRAPVAHVGDVGCMVSPFGAIGVRLANFANGELYGREVTSDLPWAMRFPFRSDTGNRVIFQNGQYFERVKDTATDQWNLVRLEDIPNGTELYLREGDHVYHATADKVPHEHLMDVWQVVTTPRHPSQLYQALVEGLILFLFLLWMRKRVKRAGVLSSLFLMGYPICRFAVEFFRQPDAQFKESSNDIGTILAGLSMGQILSIAMLIMGAVLFVYFRKHGKIIADMEVWPPDKDDPDNPDEDRPKVPFEPGTGGSSAAGDIGGIEEVRKALAKKEEEWDREHADETDDGSTPTRDLDQT